jgi:hypothetical protein
MKEMININVPGSYCLWGYNHPLIRIDRYDQHHALLKRKKRNKKESEEGAIPQFMFRGH